MYIIKIWMMNIRTLALEIEREIIYELPLGGKNEKKGNWNTSLIYFWSKNYNNFGFWVWDIQQRLCPWSDTSPPVSQLLSKPKPASEPTNSAWITRVPHDSLPPLFLNPISYPSSLRNHKEKVRETHWESVYVCVRHDEKNEKQSGPFGLSPCTLLWLGDGLKFCWRWSLEGGKRRKERQEEGERKRRKKRLEERGRRRRRRRRRGRGRLEERERKERGMEYKRGVFVARLKACSEDWCWGDGGGEELCWENCGSAFAYWVYHHGA